MICTNFENIYFRGQLFRNAENVLHPSSRIDIWKDEIAFLLYLITTFIGRERKRVRLLWLWLLPFRGASI